MLLQGKKAFVTGGATGIGRSICRAMAAEGAQVCVTDLDEDGARIVAEEIRGAGGTAIHFRLDVTKRDDVHAVLDGAVERMGRLDIVCPNAGVSTMNPIVDLTEKEWDHNFEVNTKGVFHTCQAALKKLIAQGSGGKIVITASMASKRGFPLLAHYVASKHAVVGFMKTLALEAARNKINVNAVCPGLVRTSMQEREIAWEARLRGMTEEEVLEEYVRMTPLGRLEEPEDVAKVVVMLASAYADFMTGQAINVTGGIETN